MCRRRQARARGQRVRDRRRGRSRPRAERSSIPRRPLDEGGRHARVDLVKSPKAGRDSDPRLGPVMTTWSTCHASQRLPHRRHLSGRTRRKGRGAEGQLGEDPAGGPRRAHCPLGPPRVRRLECGAGEAEVHALRIACQSIGRADPSHRERDGEQTSPPGSVRHLGNAGPPVCAPARAAKALRVWSSGPTATAATAAGRGGGGHATMRGQPRRRPPAHEVQRRRARRGSGQEKDEQRRELVRRGLLEDRQLGEVAPGQRQRAGAHGCADQRSPSASQIVTPVMKTSIQVSGRRRARSPPHGGHGDRAVRRSRAAGRCGRGSRRSG